MPLVIVLAVAVFALAHTAPFPFLLEGFHPKRSLWRVPAVQGEPPAIYLTFDDGPNPAWTPPLLDALGEHGAFATFFLIDGYVTAETASVVRRIHAEGHAIGLHTDTKRLMVTPPDELASMLAAKAQQIELLTGRSPCRLFRPHGGWRSGAMYDGLERAGYRLAGWSWGLWDFDWWRLPDAAKLADRLARKASNGDVVVIHDGHHNDPTKDRRHAAETVRRLVPMLRARGFVFRPLCASPSSGAVGADNSVSPVSP